MKYFLFIALSFSLYSGEDHHPLSKFVGDNIELITKGHTLSGQVNDKLMLGHMGHTENGAQTTLRVVKGNVITNTTFSRENGEWEGEFNDQAIVYSHLDRENPAIYLIINGVEHRVSITAEGYENNHFKNPEFAVTINGKEVKFRLLNGEMGWGYIINVLYMVLATYLI